MRLIWITCSTTSNTLDKLPWRDDADGRIVNSKQIITILANDEISLPFNGAVKKLIVFGVGGQCVVTLNLYHLE